MRDLKAYIYEGFKLGKNKVDKDDDFIDLDLSSGTLWCKYNIGAKNGSNAESWYGNFFMWGDTEPVKNKDCSWKTYKWCNGAVETLTKYCYDNDYNYTYWAGKGKPDNKSVLDEEDDMATVNMNEDWKMPTKDQCKELLYTTINKPIKDYNDIPGLNGTLFISKKNGNELFIPYAGYKHSGIIKEVGESFNIWTSSLNKKYSKVAFSFHSDEDIDNFDRCYGFSVRAVAN